MTDRLNDIVGSLLPLLPEVFLSVSILALVLTALFRVRASTLAIIGLLIFAITGALVLNTMWDEPRVLFGGMVRRDQFSSYLKMLMNIAGLITCTIAHRSPREHSSEYFALLVAIVLGGHLLAMSTHFVIVFLSIEIISLSSYVLTAFAFNKRSSESSLKYFLFGAVASAVMLYGVSFFYGLTGLLDFASQDFVSRIIEAQGPIVLFAGLLVLAGFLFKISAVPMHLWAPDVYEAAPVSVVAFLSVVPKVAAFSALIKFVLALNAFGQSLYDWQLVIAAVALITLTVGNFGALKQANPMRMMAYSSIAQSGFMLVAIVAFLPQGVQFLLFYATVYLVMNYLVFIYLDAYRLPTFAAFAGRGKQNPMPFIFLLTGLIALTGLPPTAGFTSKLFIFTSLWQSYEAYGKGFLLVLLVFGLLNTIVSLFYYLQIPYYAFLKDGQERFKHNILSFENLLGGFLVLVLFGLFFVPGLLMGWINKINFVF